MVERVASKTLVVRGQQRRETVKWDFSENLVNRQLYDYLDENKFIYRHQSSFDPSVVEVTCYYLIVMMLFLNQHFFPEDHESKDYVLEDCHVKYF